MMCIGMVVDRRVFCEASAMIVLETLPRVCDAVGLVGSG